MIGDDSFEKNQKNSKDFQTNEEMTGIVKLYNFFFNTLKKKRYKFIRNMFINNNSNNSISILWFLRSSFRFMEN